jgi:hypothetical protein
VRNSGLSRIVSVLRRRRAFRIGRAVERDRAEGQRLARPRRRTGPSLGEGDHEDPPDLPQERPAKSTGAAGPHLELTRRSPRVSTSRLDETGVGDLTTSSCSATRAKCTAERTKWAGSGATTRATSPVRRERMRDVAIRKRSSAKGSESSPSRMSCFSLEVGSVRVMRSPTKTRYPRSVGTRPAEMWGCVSIPRSSRSAMAFLRDAEDNAKLPTFVSWREDTGEALLMYVQITLASTSLERASSSRSSWPISSTSSSTGALTGRRKRLPTWLRCASA